MTRRTTHLWLILVVLLVSLVSACNRVDDTLRIALDKEDQDRYDQLFAYFTAETGIEINATYGEDIGKLVGTNDEPDIIKTSTVAVLAMKDSLLDLTPYIEADAELDTSIYIDAIIDALTIDGKIYALPTSLNTSLLYYNKTLFDERESELREALDLTPEQSHYPQAGWTYDDYRDAGVALSEYTVDVNGDRHYSQFGAETQLNWWGEWLVYLRQMGGSFYVSGSNNRVSALDSEAAYDATAFFVAKSMGDATEKFAPDAIESASGFSFMSGNTAMMLGGHLGDWFSYEALGLDWDIQILPVPTDRPDARGGELSADAFGISVRSDKPADAFAFLKMWAGEEGAKQMYRNNKVGALKNMEDIIASLPEADQKDIDISVLFDAVALAEPLPREQDFSKVMRELVMGELYKLMFEGRGSETDIQLVLNRIKTNVDSYYDNLYD